MGVTPGTEVGIQSQVFIADVVAADPGQLSINDHHLAVVAKVELKTVTRTLRGLERTDLDASRPQFVNVLRRKTTAADSRRTARTHAHPRAPARSVRP